jgi:EpsI family protein
VHEWFGFVVFVIVLGGVLGAAWLLEKLAPEPVGAVAPNRPEVTDANADQAGRSKSAAPTIIAFVIITLAAGEALFLKKLSALPARGGTGVVLAADEKNPVELPAFLGTEWIGRRTEVTAVERELLPPDTGFARRLYVAVADPRRQVFLSIVLSGRDRSSIHRPEICLVGQGWTITDATGHRFEYSRHISVAAVLESFPATLLRVQREVVTPATAGKPRGRVVVPQLVAYWFVGGDAVVATHWQRLALDAWNRVVHARADRWAYVLVQTDATDGEAAALARMQAVLDETLPVFQRPMRAR